MTVIVTQQNDRLDKICFAYYGSTANRQVEQVLDANPGLETYGILLPENVRITMPDLVAQPTTPTIVQIKLWE